MFKQGHGHKQMIEMIDIIMNIAMCFVILFSL